jgi:polyphosphate glucokinase
LDFSPQGSSVATAKTNRRERRTSSKPVRAPTKILTIDIGGSKIKLLATGQVEPRKIPSGKKLTPTHLVEAVKKATRDWEYEAVSIGYPGLVGGNGPHSEPGNLGPGWVGFNYAAAFERPVRIINDAAMQALGSYEGGRMLFLGLGTGLGSAFIAENVVLPLELGRIPSVDGATLGEVLGKAGLKRIGKEIWRKIIAEAVAAFTDAFLADYVVLGGGNAKHIKELPPGSRRGHNLTAFRGGFRLWALEDVPTLHAESGHASPAEKSASEWRVI